MVAGMRGAWILYEHPRATPGPPAISIYILGYIPDIYIWYIAIVYILYIIYRWYICCVSWTLYTYFIVTVSFSKVPCYNGERVWSMMGTLGISWSRKEIDASDGRMIPSTGFRTGLSTEFSSAIARTLKWWQICWIIIVMFWICSWTDK